METQELSKLLTELNSLPDKDQKIIRYTFKLGLTNFDDFMACVEYKTLSNQGKQWLRQLQQSKLFLEFDRELHQSPIRNYPQSNTIEWLNILGWLIFLTGASLTTIGVIYDSSVKSYAVDERVVNIGLVTNKISYVFVGGSLLITGAIFICKK